MQKCTITPEIKASIQSNLINMAPNNLSSPNLEKWMAEQRVIEEHRAIARQKMIEALPKVVALAQIHSCGGFTAATLLLNIYNRHEWHFDLVSLRNLDLSNWRACMDVLCYQTLSSPDQDVHHYIENGNKIMQQLWGRYKGTANFIGHN